MWKKSKKCKPLSKYLRSREDRNSGGDMVIKLALRITTYLCNQTNSQLVVKLAKVRIDKFGRILIPKEIRRSLGIKEETELEIEVKDEKILITLKDRSLEKKVEELMSYLKSNAPKPFVSDEEDGEKWHSAEFSMRKIGLKE